MSTRDVAVVIPCFNDGATVKEAVASALAQGPGELVVVDDGSTDASTRAVFDQLTSEGITVVHQQNGGLAAARMAGVRATTRPYVLALDADDMVAPGAMICMAEALQRDPNLAVVWGDVERFGAAGFRRYPKARTLDPWRISHVNELVASTMIRRSALLAAGGWSFQSSFEDWDLWMAMAERGMSGRHVGMTTLRYRVDQPRMYRSALRSYGRLVRELEARHPTLFRKRRNLARRADAGQLLKIAWTLIDVLPAPLRLKRFLYFGALVACEPSRRWRAQP